MLPAHQRPLGRRAHQAQQHPQHAAAGGQYYAPPSEPQQQPPHDDDRSASRRRRLPFGRHRLRGTQGALLLLVLPMLAFAAVLYKRSQRGGEVQQPQSLAVGTRTPSKPHKPPAAARPVKLQLSTFGKNETGKGETAQVWLTLANEGDAAAGADAAADVALQVYLPHPSLKFKAGSPFPALEPTSGADPAPIIHEDVDLWEDGRRFTLVSFPGAPLAPGKSRVYNLEARVEGFLEKGEEGVLRVYAQAFVEGLGGEEGEEEKKGWEGGGSDKGSVRPLASVTVTLKKRHMVTNDDLAKKREQRKQELEKAGVGVGSHWKTFADCRPYSPLAAAMTACFEACHPRGPGECLACGYDEAANACICKTPSGAAERVPIDPLPLPAGVGGYVVDADDDADEEEEEEEEPKRKKRVPFLFPIGRRRFSADAPRGKAAMTSADGGRERIAEVLVFPGLISEADCLRMDAYLDELVVREKTTRKITEDAGSPLLKLLGGAIGAVIPAGVEYLDYVTLAREDVEVSPHFDTVKGGETHKVLLFLDGTAGTRFWETQAAWRAGLCPLTLPAARGTVVVFPMALYHDSMAFYPRGALKSTLGLRAIFPPFDGGDMLGLVEAPPAGGAAAA